MPVAGHARLSIAGNAPFEWMSFCGQCLWSRNASYREAHWDFDDAAKAELTRWSLAAAVS